MKILTVSDEESSYIWDYFDRDRFKDVDLVISAGDLKARYLSFLVTMIHVPLLYVHGNHDDRYKQFPPEGCLNIEDKIYVHKGIRILGLGGSFQYSKGDNQYTEDAMRKRVKKLKKQLARYGGFDILVSHAPAYGLGDGEDLCHRGFESFLELMDKYTPSYFIHGHQHLTYDRSAKRISTYNSTTILNAFEYHMFEYEPNSNEKTVQLSNKKGLKKIFPLL